MPFSFWVLGVKKRSLTLGDLKISALGFMASLSPRGILCHLFFLTALLLTSSVLTFSCGLFQSQQVMFIDGNLSV